MATIELDRALSPKDFRASGDASDSESIQRMIDYGLSKGILNFDFLGAEYSVGTTITIPLEENSDTNKRRARFAGNGARFLITDPGVTVFSRTIPDTNTVATITWIPHFSDMIIKPPVGGGGNGIIWHASYGATFEGIHCGDRTQTANVLNKGIELIWGLAANFRNCRIYNTTQGYAVGGALFAALEPGTGNQSNLSSFINSTFQGFATNQRGFTISQAQNVTFINCGVEGTESEYGWFIEGTEPIPAGGNFTKVDTNIRWIGCWSEVTSDLTATIRANVREATLVCESLHLNNDVGAFVLDARGSIKSVFKFADSSDWRRLGVSPWFATDTPAGADERNSWVFLNNLMVGEDFQETAKWFGGVVPLQNMQERSLDTITGLIHEYPPTLSGDVFVNTIADLRARTGGVIGEIVIVRDHSVAGDEGGGEFECIADALAPLVPGDIHDATTPGDDDNGYHIVASDGTCYARIDLESPITMQKFGIVPHQLLADAVAGSDQNMTGGLNHAVQRVYDFYTLPTDYPDYRLPVPTMRKLNGFAQRSLTSIPSMGLKITNGYVRVHTPMIVRYSVGVVNVTEYEDNYFPGELRSPGKVFIPFGFANMPAYVLDSTVNTTTRSAGFPVTELNAYIERNPATGDVWWSEQNWPQIARKWKDNRPWISSATVYRNEPITHDDGTVIRRYVVDRDPANPNQSTFTLGTVAPAGTLIGSTESNGTAILRLEGIVRNSDGQDFEDKLRRNKDCGVHIRNMAGHREIRIWSDGFTHPFIMMANDTSAWSGWNHIKLQNVVAMTGGLLAAYRVEFRVLDIAARDALNATGIHSRKGPSSPGVRCETTTDGSIYEYVDTDTWEQVFNGTIPVGNYPYDPNSPDGHWINDNLITSTIIVPTRVTGGDLPSPSPNSVYGPIIDSWHATDWPNHNTYTDMSLEHPSLLTTAGEVVNALFIRGDYNSVLNVRNEQPDEGQTFVHYNQQDDPDSSTTFQNRFNRLSISRHGFGALDAADTVRRTVNDGEWNIVSATPNEEPPNSVFAVPNIRETGTFSGDNAFFSRVFSSYEISSAFNRERESIRLESVDDASPTNPGPAQYRVADDSFNFSLNHSLTFMVDLPDNREGLARIAIDLHGIDQDVDADTLDTLIQRWYSAILLDENNNPIAADIWSTSPIPFFNDYDSFSSYIRKSARPDFSRSALLIVPRPFVRRFVMRIAGPGIKGLTAKLYGLPGGSIGPFYEHADRTVNQVDALPKQGKFYPPYEVTYRDDPSIKFHLPHTPVAPGTADKLRPVYATAGEEGAIGTPTRGFPVVHSDTGVPRTPTDPVHTIKQWDGTQYVTVATNAVYAEPADWVGDASTETAYGQLDFAVVPSGISLDGVNPVLLAGNLFDSTLTDGNMIVDIATGSITVPKTGMYAGFFTYNFRSTAKNVDVDIEFLLNGSPIPGGLPFVVNTRDTTNTGIATVWSLIPAQANDSISSQASSLTAQTIDFENAIFGLLQLDVTPPAVF